MTKCRAAICEETGKPFVLDEIEVDDPREGEVLVKLRATGICRTDLLAWKGKTENVTLPAVLGHEGAGIVAKVGKGVAAVREGDHVIPLYIPECGECAQCRSEQTNLCAALTDRQRLGLMPDGTTRLSWRGRPLSQFMGTSTFAEYAVVPEIALAKIGPEIPPSTACLFACGITAGAGAPLWALPVSAGSSVAVFGCGMVGLNVIQGARLAQAGTVIAVDMLQDRLEKAVEFGATNTVDASQKNAVQRIRRLTGGGADYTFEATGKTAVMREAFDSCRWGGGKCCLIGLSPAGEELRLTPHMFTAGRTLTGAAFGGAKGRRHVPQLIDWYREGRIKTDGLVSEEIGLDRINWAFERMAENSGLRYVVTY